MDDRNRLHSQIQIEETTNADMGRGSPAQINVDPEQQKKFEEARLSIEGRQNGMNMQIKGSGIPSPAIIDILKGNGATPPTLTPKIPAELADQPTQQIPSSIEAHPLSARLFRAMGSLITNHRQPQVTGAVSGVELHEFLMIIKEYMERTDHTIKELQSKISNTNTQGFMMPVGEPIHYNVKLVRALEKFEHTYGKVTNNLSITGKLIELVRFTTDPQYQNLIDVKVNEITYQPEIQVINPVNKDLYRLWSLDPESRKKYEESDVELMTMYSDVFDYLFNTIPGNVA